MNLLPGIKELQYLSPLRYAFEVLVRNEFDGSIFNPADDFLHFHFKIWEVYAIMGGYCFILIILSMLRLKTSSRDIDN